MLSMQKVACEPQTYFRSLPLFLLFSEEEKQRPEIRLRFAGYAKGAPLNHCFWFIDGTVRPISRPGQHQRIVYNGHKRVHSLKFQSVALPNGLIGNIYIWACW